MKVLLNILIIVLLGLSACKEQGANKQVQSVKEKYSNQFFTLDLERGNIGMDSFKAHFFTNFPHNDPTRGDVVYDQSEWLHDDILQMEENNGLLGFLRFRQDSTGFDSYRLTSRAFYNLNEQDQKILFVFKGSLPMANGMWPAWWLNGSVEKEWLYEDSIPSLTDEMLVKYSGKGISYETKSSVNNTDWPGAGEIDIIENINNEKYIHNTIHTCPQMCDSEWNEDGQIINCANAQPGDLNKGCSGRKYPINNLEGTFACVWEKASISFYHWLPDADVRANNGPLSANPDPQFWKDELLKNKVKLLETDEVCDVATHQDWQCTNCANSNDCSFRNLKMIFNVTLCGIWAGEEFDSTGQSMKNCTDFILGEGKDAIDGQFMKIEYVAVKGL